LSDERKLRAEALVRLTESNDGRLFLGEIQTELDNVMKKVMYCDDDELRTVRGHARALFEILKKFEDAKKTLRS
jgi:hypothetical protein